jgi:hypothetical protein
LDTDFQLAADFDLWRRFAFHADLYLVTVLLGGFRIYDDQKTASRIQQYYQEVDQCLSESGVGSWLHKLVKNKTGRRLCQLYQETVRSNKVIRYKARDNRWKIGR